jgi:ammonium transporter, Amt family
LWWWLGFGFAFGETKGRFIGTSLFGMNDSSFKSTNANAQFDSNFPFFFFQWAFAATAATIVSGSMAERCKLESYFLYTMFISMFVYPVVVHWVWGEGWLSAFGTDPSQFLFRGSESNNMIDFAGSGVVHMVGGFSGLMGAAILGPRLKRFNKDGVPVPIHGHNMVFTVLGTILLWVGWYGFNCGSTLAIVGYSKLAGKIAVTTTIAAATAGCTSLLYCRVFLEIYDMGLICNAVLAGLVGITAGCAVVEPWGAFLIGVSSCIVYVLASKFILESLKIDDPVDASALHGCTGLWGVIAVGIFGTDENAQFAGYNGSANGHHPFRTGEQFGVQIVGGVCILVWTCLASGILFLFIDKVIGLRVSEEDEIKGLDAHHHGKAAYQRRESSKHLDTSDVEMTSQPKNNGHQLVPSEPSPSV